jgi:hypothetical protein
MDKLDLLLSGEIEIEGLIHDSSNGALKVLVSNSQQSMHAIIKPEVSIRPLWDFPDMDLNNREYATYLLDRALELNYVPEIESDEVEGPDVLRVHLSAEQGRLFAERGRRLVSAGRQPCPFCQEPLGQQGHICARANGYKR